MNMPVREKKIICFSVQISSKGTEASSGSFRGISVPEGKHRLKYSDLIAVKPNLRSGRILASLSYSLTWVAR